MLDTGAEGQNGNGGGAGATQRLKCMKYLLMVINSFGVLLGFFIVLFGMAYPRVSFPGGYTGEETAMFAGVFIFFSLIGYCGVCPASALTPLLILSLPSSLLILIILISLSCPQAAHQKVLFLVPYAVAIFFGMLYNFFNWFTSDQDCLDPRSLSLR